MSDENMKDEQNIRDLAQTWSQASMAGDYAALEEMMHPGIIFLTSGSEPMNRDAFRDNFLNVVRTLRLECTVDTREVEVSGNLAYAWNWISIRLKGASEDVTAARENYALSIYKRNTEGRWQLWRDANVLYRQSS